MSHSNLDMNETNYEFFLQLRASSENKNSTGILIDKKRHKSHHSMKDSNIFVLDQYNNNINILD